MAGFAAFAVCALLLFGEEVRADSRLCRVAVLASDVCVGYWSACWSMAAYGLIFVSAFIPAGQWIVGVRDRSCLWCRDGSGCAREFDRPAHRRAYRRARHHRGRCGLSAAGCLAALNIEAVRATGRSARS